jgi:hypothetical protein
MTKEELIESAKKLSQPTSEAVEEYAQKREHLVAEINRMLMNRKDLTDLIGEGNELMMKDNHSNHARFMESIFRFYKPEVLVETVLWVFRAYRSHGFHLTYWPAQLNAWVQVLERELTLSSCKSVLPFYNWLIVNIPVFSKLTDYANDK